MLFMYYLVRPDWAKQVSVRKSLGRHGQEELSILQRELDERFEITYLISYQISANIRMVVVKSTAPGCLLHLLLSYRSESDVIIQIFSHV